METIPSFDDIFDIPENSNTNMDNIPCISIQPPTFENDKNENALDDFANNQIDNFFNLVASSPSSFSETESGYESNSPMQMDEPIDDAGLVDTISDLFPDLFALK